MIITIRSVAYSLLSLPVASILTDYLFSLQGLNWIYVIIDEPEPKLSKMKLSG